MSLRVVERDGYWWVMGTYLTERVRKTTSLVSTTLERPHAEKIRRYFEQQIGEGTWNKHRPVVKHGKTVFEAVNDYLLLHHGLMLGGYYAIRDFAKQHATVKICDLRSSDVQAFIVNRFTDDTGKWRVKTSTVRTESHQILRMLKIEHDLGNITKPIKVQLPTANPGRTNYLTPEQVGKVIATADDNLRPLFVFLLGTGARLAEAVRLTWTDIDLDKGTALLTHLKGKTRGTKTRQVPLTPRVVDELRKIEKPSGGVFSNKYGHALTVSTASKVIFHSWNIQRGKLGLDNCTVHDFRHTFASNLALNGVELRRIADLLGHQSMERTRRYAHLLPSTLRDEVMKLPYFMSFRTIYVAPHNHV